MVYQLVAGDFLSETRANRENAIHICVCLHFAYSFPSSLWLSGH